MTTEQVQLAITSAIALVALLLSVLTWRRTVRADLRTQAHAARLAALESPITTSAAVTVEDSDPTTFVITDIDRTAPDAAAVTARRIEGRLFADIVARETVVKAASWTRGVRRALAPETRNRIRFQIRQETKRAGRERKAEMKLALREHRARSRGAAADVSSLGEDVA
ncbi:MAG: hypothetical protein LH477_09020 [Nocardioides sp.]|nr:hypothetical protein [Nocardioides sp.]